MEKRAMKSKEDAVKGIELFFDSLNMKNSYVSHVVMRTYMIDLISYNHHPVQIDKYYNHTAAIGKLEYNSDNEQIVGIILMN